SGYNHYIAAVVAAGDPVAAARGFQPRERGVPPPYVVAGDSPISVLTVAGHETHRIDGVERASGKATYTGDVMLPGMLYARVLRSPHPHARIRRIDVTKALALPGVKAVISHENCTVLWGAGSIAGGAQYNKEEKKHPNPRRYAFNNPVRSAGEPVAAVAAVDRHTAEE